MKVDTGAWTNETLIAVMETHITNVVTHFKGICYAWHVVNEAIEDIYNPGYRETVFSKVIGGDFIPIAFSAAHAADKDAKLYYTDYGLESMTEKLNAAIIIVDDIQSRGIRIDGVGLQGHSIVGATPSRESLAATLHNFTSMGLEVAWTEVEIRHTTLPPTEAALQQQAQDYAAIVGSCLDVKECVGVTLWQFTDRYNWVPQSIPGEGDACLWSADYERRPAYDAIMDLLRGTINGTLKITPPTTPAPAKSAAGRLSMGTVGGLVGAALSAWLLL
jgi:endo-1,4-beta-xylanase